ncbi:hypothetical protein PIB30_095736, partial [Stylosanthes scabra]|nr:hypothetical protein [Stylosanthes scabra]
QCLDIVETKRLALRLATCRNDPWHQISPRLTLRSTNEFSPVDPILALFHLTEYHSFVDLMLPFQLKQ